VQTLNDRLVVTFDRFLAAQRRLAAEINGSGPRVECDHLAFDAVQELAHRQAEELTDLLSASGGGSDVWPQAKVALHAHRLHSEVLLQSEFIAHAFQKPRGYAGDKDLMLQIYEKRDRGATPFAVLTNRVYQELPAAEAVRQRIRSLERLLAQVPRGGRVLNLACGPGREVERFMREHPVAELTVDLVDHDIETIRYTTSHIRDPRVRHFIGNAFAIIKGDHRVLTPRGWARDHCDPKADLTRSRGAWLIPLKYKFSALAPASYDLVYSAGLFDYVEDFPENPQRGARALTRRLCDLLKPGGHLLIGNFLTQGCGNPHRLPHRLMMELYSDWCLLYRSQENLYDFATHLAQDEFEINLTNEYLDPTPLRPAAIGFLQITRAR